MKAESALGLREAVSERYERLRALLDERLGPEPAQETRLLHRRLFAQTERGAGRDRFPNY